MCDVIEDPLPIPDDGYKKAAAWYEQRCVDGKRLFFINFFGSI